MGKGNELWDDSILVNAFDRAVASFKTEAEAEAEEAEEAEEAVDDENKTTPAAQPQPQPQPQPTISNISHQHTYQDDKAASNEQIQDAQPLKGNLDNSYDQLLNQYYELEEKRQTVLQQLYAHPTYYNQTSQPDFCHATPEHAAQNPQYLNPLCAGYCLPVPVLPASGGNCCGPYNSCFTTCQICDKCPNKYAGCTVAVPCSPDLAKQSCGMDHSTDLKKGMMVAESAMRAVNANTSGKESETVGINECLQAIATSDTDLVPVLNAWYSAGFHTARYLVEKSRQNNS